MNMRKRKLACEFNRRRSDLVHGFPCKRALPAKLDQTPLCAHEEIIRREIGRAVAVSDQSSEEKAMPQDIAFPNDDRFQG
ncbi:hypothetical protein V1291_002596 [Nitrobacteraceae bacterium AZCC 1564]